MNKKEFLFHGRRTEWLSRDEVDRAIDAIEFSTDTLEELWGVPLNIVTINSFMFECSAETIRKKLSFGLPCVGASVQYGAMEYDHLEYLIDVGDKKNRFNRRYSKIIHGVNWSTYQLVAHEYAHVLTTGLFPYTHFIFSSTKGRYKTMEAGSHGIEFEIIYAKMLDEVIPYFGAVTRLMEKKRKEVFETFDKYCSKPVRKLLKARILA